MNFKESLGSSISTQQMEKLSISLLSSIGFGFLLCVIYLFLLKKYTGGMITATIVSLFLVKAISVGVLFFMNLWPIAVVILIYALFMAYFFYTLRSRIPLVQVLLKTVSQTSSVYSGTFVTAFMGLLFQISFMILWIYALLGVSKMPNVNVEGSRALLAFLVFHLYWFKEVVQNTIRVTIAGLFASFYFQSVQHPTNPSIRVIPGKAPTWKSAKRALTTSFGSICFGSLMIGFVSFLRFLVSMSRSRDRNSPLEFVFCCLDCFLAIIESFVNFFSKYAFVHVAIYGKSFYTSGKDTWHLFQSRGMETLANDYITEHILSFAMVLVGLLTMIPSIFILFFFPFT